MPDQHPTITPPPELVKQLASESLATQNLCNRAAQWGYDQRGEVNEAELQEARDQELEACCRELEYNFMPDSGSLRAARRPKPPSLKQQALKTLEDAPGPDYPRAMTVLNADQHALIRRALEALPDD